MHTFTPQFAVGVRCLPQGHLDSQEAGVGDRTSNLLLTSQPALCPEPHATCVAWFALRHQSSIDELMNGEYLQLGKMSCELEGDAAYGLIP